eukprot:CAMPEP_0204600214 /NCGR_PEP_ID=MMETSP0661-20131031/55306_1 /ASSEMBLY_ACC=CAM_ASM_000606 /TAXON_ID=109239 /ORGANISM="Alexandrium margalefi, Strain AMGDE01CS-322" /LENGTH=164 /DNA_ID=CAMNT_0051611005 /DNA_START=87 /DNA_END=579 /DNA_ORIENTATION=+
MAAIDDFRAGVSVWFFIFMIADVLTGNVAAPWLPLAVVSTACSVVLMLVSIKETDSEKIDKLKSLKAGLESKCPMLVSKAAKGAIVILLMLVSWLASLAASEGLSGLASSSPSSRARSPTSSAGSSVAAAAMPGRRLPGRRRSEEQGGVRSCAMRWPGFRACLP